MTLFKSIGSRGAKNRGVVAPPNSYGLRHRRREGTILVQNCCRERFKKLGLSSALMLHGMMQAYHCTSHEQTGNGYY